MTEKRFTIEPTGIRECILDNTNGEQLDTFDYTERLCELLNELNDNCEFLEIENESLEDGATRYVELYHKSLKENEELKKVLGAILLEVKQDISNTNQTGEIRVFINPNSFELISEVLRKYGALKGWYE